MNNLYIIEINQSASQLKARRSKQILQFFGSIIAVVFVFVVVLLILLSGTFSSHHHNSSLVLGILIFIAIVAALFIGRAISPRKNILLQNNVEQTDTEDESQYNNADLKLEGKLTKTRPVFEQLFTASKGTMSLGVGMKTMRSSYGQAETIVEVLDKNDKSILRESCDYGGAFSKHLESGKYRMRLTLRQGESIEFKIALSYSSAMDTQ